jgi:uncharacterized protein YndB with AHSA1/START domain
MTERSVIHATFTLERRYDVAIARVFAAWADAAKKAEWFASPGSEHALDFRIGGRETVSGSHEGGPVMTFETTYHDIVTDERIAYTSNLLVTDTLATTSLTTIEFTVEDGGTRLLLTEHGAFLDGHEQPAWREEGTSSQLDALGAALDRPAT